MHWSWDHPHTFWQHKLGGWGDSTKTKNPNGFLETSCIVCNPSIAYTHFAFEFFILQHLKVIVLTFCTFLENSHLPRPWLFTWGWKGGETWQFLGTKVGGKQNWKRKLLSLHSHHSSLWKTDAHKLQYGSCANMRWRKLLGPVPDLEVDTVTNWKEQILHLIKATCMHWYCKKHSPHWQHVREWKRFQIKTSSCTCVTPTVFTTSFNSFTRPGKMSFVKQSFSRFWQKCLGLLEEVHLELQQLVWS